MDRRAFLFGAGSILTGSLQAADWPQWRGASRDGISPERGLLREWPPGGPRKLWTANGLGAGFASVAVSDGRLYTQGQFDGGQAVLALDAVSGEKLWERRNAGAFSDRRGSGPRGTPTIDGDRVYALSAAGSLLCADAETGEEVWRHDLLRRFKARNIHWGISESPLIDGDRLVVNPGGSGASIVALMKSSGELLWKSQSDEAGYSSAVVAEVDGLRSYVLLTGDAAVGVRADNGELLWRYERAANGTANVATPIVRGDKVFVSSDYGTGCALLQLRRNGGGMSAEEVYFNRDMKNHYSSCVLLGDHLYGFSSSILTCMAFETGNVAWRDRSVGKGQVIAADGMLYLQGEGGVIGLAEATPEAYVEKSRFEIGRGDYPNWALPALADGRLYLRAQDELHCYQVAS